MTLRRIQTRTHQLLEGGDGIGDVASRRCDLFLAILVIANVVAIVLDSVPEVHRAWGDELDTFETVSVGIFTLEYLLRVWAAGAPHGDPEVRGWRGRWAYISSFHGIVDLLATVQTPMKAVTSASTRPAQVTGVMSP